MEGDVSTTLVIIGFWFLILLVTIIIESYKIRGTIADATVDILEGQIELLKELRRG